MSLEKNKAIVRKMYEALNKQDLSLLVDLTSPDYVNHTKDYTIEGGKQSVKMDLKGFPDFRVTIEDIHAEGDKVWVNFRFTGTHKGEWNLFGIPLAPTGKKITWTGVNIWRIVEGKIVERKSVRDMLDFFN